MSELTPGPLVTPPTPKDSTVGEYDLNLPIGVVENDALNKTFSFIHDLTMETEEAIDKLSKRKGDADHPGQRVRNTLAYTLGVWGPYTNWQELPWPQRVKIIDSSHMEDVLYAWVWYRIQQMGEDYSIEFTCPHCDVKQPWSSDLRKMEVKISTQIPYGELVLRRGIPVGKTVYRVITAEPPRWQIMTAIGADGLSVTEVKRKLLLSAVRGLRVAPGEQEVIASPGMLKKLTRPDAEALQGWIATAFPGADLTHEIECSNEACGRVTRHETLWVYNFFFGHLSTRPIERV